MKLTETKYGTIIEIYVKPSQPTFKITIEGEDYVIFSTEEPVKGRVNKEIVRELTKLFHVSVGLVSGATSKQKRLMIKGLGKADTERILTEATFVQ